MLFQFKENGKAFSFNNGILCEVDGNDFIKKSELELIQEKRLRDLKLLYVSNDNFFMAHVAHEIQAYLESNKNAQDHVEDLLNVMKRCYSKDAIHFDVSRFVTEYFSKAEFYAREYQRDFWDFYNEIGGRIYV